MTWAFDPNVADGAVKGEPSNWDVVTIGGVQCPGTARVSVDGDSGIDVKKPKGGKRAKIDDQGAPPLSIDIELTLLPNDLVGFATGVLPLLRNASKSKGLQPLEMVHPQCAIWGFSNIIISKVRVPHPSDGKIAVKIKAREWVPQPAENKASNTIRSGTVDGRSNEDLAEPSQFLTDPLYASRGEYKEETYTLRQKQADGTYKEVPVNPFLDDDEIFG